jgi:achaete-scute complex protein
MFLDEDSEQCEYIVAGKFSSPSCKELGIPRDDKQTLNCNQTRDSCITRNNDVIKYNINTTLKPDPFSPFCMIPLPAPFGSSLFDPTCIRRRNERERERVRCVNDGYIRLKEHLPIKNKNKRISKVETLRGAIRYIKYLQTVLGDERAMQGNTVYEYSTSNDSDASKQDHFSRNDADTDSETDMSYLSSDSTDALSD